MAYNAIDVTTGKGDTLYGPLFWFDGEYTEELDFTLDPKTEPGWVQIGEASTEGIDVEQEADKIVKMVWGKKNLGANYSNFKDTVLVRHASSTDPDVLGVIYGKENISKVNGKIQLKVKNRQPSNGSLLVMAVTDDGRKNWIFIQKAQPDLNLSYTFGDEDIVIFEVTYDCLQTDDGTTHIQLIETPVAPEPEE